MVFILNFNVSRNLAEVRYAYDSYGGTNIDILLQSFAEGKTEWSVPKSAKPGDIAVFMCAVTARQNLGLATSRITAQDDPDFFQFVANQKIKYQHFSGNLLGVGTVASAPVFDSQDRRWYAEIVNLFPFFNLISIDDFRSFITISRTGSVTFLNDTQWARLQWIVNQKNPGSFPNAVAPEAEDLQKEYEKAVQKESSRPLSELKKDAAKKSSKPAASTVQTKVYHRDPTISAYVKKRANGYCQLCNTKAPFNDQNGDPYLECHHIEWLSKGGMDSADNCVALCPNCHRKMHILNDPNDILLLKGKIL